MKGKYFGKKCFLYFLIPSLVCVYSILRDNKSEGNTFSVRSLKGGALFYCADKGMIVAFCGHSYFLKTAEMENTLLSILQERVGDEPCDFYLGGYGSFDSFARECCKKYQQEHPTVRLVLILPYLNRPIPQKDLYDATVYPEIEAKPKRFAILYRNKWMVERASLVIAYINHTWGGAYTTYLHARRRKKAIINLGKLT